MSTVTHVLRPAHFLKFADLWRREGLGPALARAVYFLRLVLRGEVAGEVAAQAGGGKAQGGHRFQLAPVWSSLARDRAFHVSKPPAVLTRTRTVAMIGDLNLPQCRKYRVEQMDELWQAAGVSYRFAHYEDVPRCREILQGATHLMLYRLARSDLATMYMYEARRLKLPVLYDIDDPLFSVSAYEGYSNAAILPAAMRAHFLSEAPLYLDVMNMADAVSLSTPGLVAHAAGYTARTTFLRRNFADRVTLEQGARALREARRREGVTLAVASGSQGHTADLQVIRAPLTRFLEGGRDRRLMIVGHLDRSVFPGGVQERIEARPFTDYATYLGNLAEADCALMPLTDDAFNGCKSGVRVIDAAAVGVASLVSDVGDCHALIVPGETGEIVPAGGWDAALAALADDPGGQRAMGVAARRVLERRWGAGLSLPVVDPEMIAWVKA